jgi:uracil-DNA glycosylase
MAPAPDNKIAAPKPSPVLIVADAPQLDANGQALAFSAISHPLFEQFLRAASWLARAASDKDSRTTSGEPNDEIMITHMVKCVGARPSVDPQHYLTCLGYLHAQIKLLKPHVLLIMGRMAAQALVNNTEWQGLPHGKLCGRELSFDGTPMVITQSPEYLWRTGQDKAKAWHDLCLTLSLLE